MTVRDLIAVLEKADPDAEVWLDSYPCDTAEAHGKTVTLSGEELAGALDTDPRNGF